ncbi:MFS transporter [Devosia sp.]|uniref:MFS transporter n=1 Tax=Devosia sp. TaxID=1871048 RepID=UPI003A8C9119
MTDPAPAAEAHVLRLPAFRLFLVSRALSSIGFQGSAVAIGWLVYDTTRNPFDLGLVGLAQFLPMLILAFVAGHVADQFDRRRIGLVCQIIEAATLGVLALGVFQGWLPVWGVFVGVAVIGAAQAFERPTMAALLPAIVPLNQLQTAVATSTSVMQTSMIIGPALGGLLYGLGPVVPFVFAASCFAAASFAVTALPPPKSIPIKAPVTLKRVFAGLAFIRSKPVMLGAISLDLFAVLLGGATAMLPVYARDILFAGPWALGFLRTAPAVGAVVMSLLLVRFPLKHNVGRDMLIAVAIFGVATLVFALSTNIILSVTMLAILGAADTVSVVVRSSLVQLMTPDEMRGRVNAVNALFVGASNQLGEFRAGTFAGFMGPVGAVVFGGIGTLVVVAVWAKIFPDLRKVDTLEG